MVYCPNHPYAVQGRVLKHRVLVEQNYQKFDQKYFHEINGWMVLKPNISVHHLDYNHDNNDINNLIPCTKSEHSKYHLATIIERDCLGRIVKTAVFKRGELLGNLEKDNQQPSQELTSLEGSETNTWNCNTEYNSDTSTLHHNNDEDIVRTTCIYEDVEPLHK